MSVWSSWVIEGARRATALALASALVAAPGRASAETDEVETRTVGLAIASSQGSTIVAGIERWAAIEARRQAQADQGAGAPVAKACGSSFAVKAAFVVLLVGGAIMLVYGPQEKENGVVSRDGKSEAIGGAGAIVLSMLLLRDILSKPPAAAARP